SKFRNLGRAGKQLEPSKVAQRRPCRAPSHGLNMLQATPIRCAKMLQRFYSVASKRHGGTSETPRPCRPYTSIPGEGPGVLQAQADSLDGCTLRWRNGNERGRGSGAKRRTPCADH